ncbi:cytochrome c oxidase subunit II [Halorubellus sp. PRR65]|uniref:cytochrome c oxidase subunit II n=1 Tax=Halorubellus sp. PRR65 TaxID=3098148 RepID=UPI002B256718|nr:cytochrome c oxidase subunit II [Halorubellus sp. PRR65]
MVTLATLLVGLVGPAQLVPEGSRAVVFRRIYEVFLVLGTAVGVIVIAYMLWKAWKYRAAADHGDDADRPELGELPSGGGGGRKLFLSFSLSAIVVVSLISWTYLTLLYVENPEPVQDDEEPLTVRVVGHSFFWEFVYPNGQSVNDTLRVPEDRRVRLVVTSDDVFHNFGIPELRAKSDAIPGQETDTWFVAEDTGTYQANCYELCGAGHSHMTATVQVLSQSGFQSWYQGTGNEGANDTAASMDENATANDTASALATPTSAASSPVLTAPGASAPSTRVLPSPPASTVAPARHASVATRHHPEVI